MGVIAEWYCPKEDFNPLTADKFESARKLVLVFEAVEGVPPAVLASLIYLLRKKAQTLFPLFLLF